MDCVHARLENGTPNFLMTKQSIHHCWARIAKVLKLTFRFLISRKILKRGKVRKRCAAAFEFNRETSMKILERNAIELLSYSPKRKLLK
jgi:hypothetical protein